MPPPLPGNPPPLPGGAPGGGAVPPPLPGAQTPAGAVPPPLPPPGRSEHAAAAPQQMPDPGPLPEPDPMPDPGVLHVTEQTRTYPCATCGGMLVFSPERDQLVCRSCGAGAPMTASRQLGVVVKHDLRSAMRALEMRQSQAEAPSGDKEVVCQSCGGHTMFSGTLTAVRCPYCATPVQRNDVHDSPARLPVDGILPLRIGEDQALKLIERWINSRRLAPNEFKKYRTLGSFTSIYLPYFNYDADTITHYQGRRGEYYYVTVGSGDNKRRERRTRWYPASGTVWNQFRDVEGLASTQGLDEKKVEALSPWPLEGTLGYSPEFVAGHLSRTYDMDAREVHNLRVDPAFRNRISGTVRSHIGGDTQQITSMNVVYQVLNYAQVMLPVWLLTVTYKQKPYQVFINGITGEVQGYRPWSAAKITVLAILAAIIIGVLVYLYVTNQ